MKRERARWTPPSGPRVVVLGCGNPSRGDDGLGPELLARLEGHAAHLARHCDLEIVGDFQLQVEHALDLEGRDLALFIDASVACGAPCELQRLVPGPDPSFTTHALSPAAVLHAYRQVRGQEPPPAYLLSVQGLAFELGEPLGEAAAKHLEAAWFLLHRLLDDPCPEAWDELSLAAV